jgi:hypothetical protein
MSANPQPEPDRLEVAADQAIGACGGNVREALKAMIANEHLKAEVCELMQAVSHAYTRGRFQAYNANEALKESFHMRPGQQLGVDMANNFMLMTLFTIVGDMAEDPDGFRTNVTKALFDLADNYSLPRVAPEMANEARDAAKQIIAGVLQNPQSVTPQ